MQEFLTICFVCHVVVVMVMELMGGTLSSISAKTLSQNFFIN